MCTSDIFLQNNSVKTTIKLQVGGTILAAKLAKERGWAINVGGGFHHCSAGKGGGFCAYADISLCINFALTRLNISRYYNVIHHKLLYWTFKFESDP